MIQIRPQVLQNNIVYVYCNVINQIFTAQIGYDNIIVDKLYIFFYKLRATEKKKK